MTDKKDLIQVDKWKLQEVLLNIDKMGFSIDNQKKDFMKDYPTIYYQFRTLKSNANKIKEVNKDL